MSELGGSTRPGRVQTEDVVYAACVGRFYEELARRLVTGATKVFTEAGASLELHEVPGAFELPLAAKYCAESGRYAGVACLGAVIRGETSHYDHVCEAAASGIARVSLDTGVPCAFGVLTVETMDQGWSMKKLLRRLVLSATYRQSSRVTPELLSRDRDNRLLARGPLGDSPQPGPRTVVYEQFEERLKGVSAIESSTLKV